MRARSTFRRVVVGLLAGALVAAAASAQPAAQPPSQRPARPAPPGEADPGVRPIRLIDRDEIRVSRVELQPGAVRSVHAHDDVEYHVWAPVEGSLEITIGTEAPAAAKAGQAFFMKRGTRHGFRNTGSTPAAVFEIFVKTLTTRAAIEGQDAPDPHAILADALAHLAAR